jgi:UDP-N-acetylmuramoyl-tripeptide--D-alanyl-D-alanine ligase
MTMLWTGPDLRAATGGAFSAASFEASGVSIDSRATRPGDLFVALRDQRDGHDFVADALLRGATGALVSQVPAGVADDAPLLLVGDTLDGLRALAAFARARFSGRLVAVTGSVGKTTTKEMLRTILSASGKTFAAEASHNNQWGVPLTLARLPPDAAFCVAEIGMNHAGEIAPLARLAQPHVTVITNVERAHIGHLGSLEAIADEKASIMTGLVAGGIAVLPGDSVSFPRLLAAAGAEKTIVFGTTDKTATARLVSAAPDPDGTDITADIAGAVVSFRLGAPGLHMAMNVVAALAAAAALGTDPLRGAAALAEFSAVGGRGARRRIAVAGGEALLLDESYNASSAAVRAALAVLALQPAARRIAVLGDMLELGDDGPAEHVGLAPAVAESADALFTCGKLTRLLFDAVPVAMRSAHAEDSAALAPVVAAALRPGDAVLVKGSLGMRMRRVVDAIAGAPA